VYLIGPLEQVLHACVLKKLGVFMSRCGVRWGKGKLELPDGSKAVHPGAARKAAQAAAEAAASGIPQLMDDADAMVEPPQL
jgi:hypothetical protein